MSDSKNVLHSKNHANVYMYYLTLKTLKATINIICASYQHIPSALNSHFIACSAKNVSRPTKFPAPVVKMLSFDSSGFWRGTAGGRSGLPWRLLGTRGFSSTRLAVQGPPQCSAALVHGGWQREACPAPLSGFCSTSKGAPQINSCPSHPKGHISSTLYQCVPTVTFVSSTEPQSCPGSQL